MRLAGIGAPEVKLVSKAEAATYSVFDWIHKFQTAERTLLIRKVRGAISLDWLRGLYALESSPIRYRWTDDCGWDSARMKLFTGFSSTILELGRPWKLRNGRQFYADFTLPRDTRKIREAIEWNGKPRLKINAARLLFGISTAHIGNILVDAAGNLFSIDHESMVVRDGSDVELLAENVRRPSLAESVIRTMVSLFCASAEEYVDIILDGLPEPWTMGSKAATADYFKRRLKDFQDKFKA